VEIAIAQWNLAGTWNLAFFHTRKHIWKQLGKVHRKFLGKSLKIQLAKIVSHSDLILSLKGKTHGPYWNGTGLCKQELPFTMRIKLEEGHKKEKLEVNEISASSKNITAKIHPCPHQRKFVDQ